MSTQTEPVPAPTSPISVASLGRRSGAYLIDVVVLFAILVGVFIVVLIVAAVASGGSFHFHVAVRDDSTSKQLVTYAAVFGVFALVPLTYISVLTSRSGNRRGATLGKAALDLRIVQLDGTEISKETARKRAAIFALPSLIPAVVGPLLDAAFGTPPTFTAIANIAVALFWIFDLVIVPLRGDDLRRTLHDRLTGTVVVGPLAGVVIPEATAVPGGAAGVTPAGRPKSGLTWLYATVLTLVLGASITFSALNGSGGSTESNFGDQADTSDTSSSSTQASASTTDTLVRSEITLAKSDPSSEAIRIAKLLGRQYAECFTSHFQSLDACDNEKELGMPPMTLVGHSMDAAVNGTKKLAGLIVQTGAQRFKHDGGFIGIYDNRGILWGYGVSTSGDIYPACLDIASARCGSTPDGAKFLADKSAVEDIVTAAGG